MRANGMLNKTVLRIDLAPHPAWPIRLKDRKVKVAHSLASLLLLLATTGGIGGDLVNANDDAIFERQRVVLLSTYKLPQNAAGENDRVGIERDPQRIYVHVPSAVQTDSNVSAPKVDRADQALAAQLFSLSKAAADAGRFEWSYRCLYEVLRHDPTHADARRMLGLAKQPTALVWRSTRKAHPRYQWAVNTYIQADSAHFRISSDQSRADVVRLAAELETLQGVFRQLFLRHWLPPSRWSDAWHRGFVSRPTRTKHQVVLFSDRDQYVRYLTPLEPRAAITRGYYHAPSRTAFLYGSLEEHRSTWLHEVTHQLFQETGSIRNPVGEQANFWILEGIAMYFESMQSLGADTVVGGVDADRLQYARFRALQERDHLPLGELVQLGRADFQARTDIRAVYSQAAGLTHFLMHGRDGAYRDAVISYLDLIYSGRDRPNSLQELMPRTLGDLDRDYLSFLRIEDADLAAIDRRVRVYSLSLGGTSVTDAGLLVLPPLDHLVWFEANGRPVTGRGLAGLRYARHLRQLSLVRTDVRDEDLTAWLPIQDLQELDLSGTSIDDRGLTAVSTCSNLRSLRLTHTRITDRGLAELAKLQQLERVDVSQTQVTARGQAKLQETLPNLEFE